MRRSVFIIICLLASCVCAWLSGCQHFLQPVRLEDKETQKPAQEFRVGYFHFMTGDQVDESHPLFKELETLPERICKELALPLPDRLVDVHLFTSEAKYRDYCKQNFQNVPSRRALFVSRQDGIGSPSLSVYAFWGEHVTIDLRHELTHATLHAIVGNVPLWLDEGLAECFETAAKFKGINHKHLNILRTGSSFIINLERLEELTQVQEMTAADYREAWLWVHWMLNHSAKSKETLSSYLRSQRNHQTPPKLKPLLLTLVHDPEEELLRYLRTLQEKSKTWGDGT